MTGGSIDLKARGGGKATYSSGLVGHTLLNSTWRAAVNKFNRLPASSRTPSAMNDLVTEAYAKTFGSQNLPAVSKILEKAGFTWTGNKLVAPTKKSADGKGVDFSPNFLGIQYSADVNNSLYRMTAKNNVAGSFNVSSDVANDILSAALSGAYGDDYKSRLDKTDTGKLDKFVTSFRSGTRPKSARVMQDSDGRWYYEAEYIDGSSKTPASIAVPLSTSRNLQHLMGLSSELDFNTSEESLMQKKLLLAKYQSIIENKRANATIDPNEVEGMDIVMDAALNSPSFMDTSRSVFKLSK